MKGIPVSIKVEYKKTVSSRVKGAGNAYLNRFSYKMVTQKICKGKSAGSAKLCSFIPKRPVNIELPLQKTPNRTHTTTIQAWVIGKNYVVWEGQDLII